MKLPWLPTLGLAVLACSEPAPPPPPPSASPAARTRPLREPASEEAKLEPLRGHALLTPGTRLSTAPEGSAASFALEVDARGALFTIVGERDGWVEVHSWFPEGPAHGLPPACVPLARGLEVVDVAFFVRREGIDPGMTSEQNPLDRFGCKVPASDEAGTEAAPPELQSGRPRVRLPRGRGSTLTEHELAAGTSLSWPDGSPAGKVRLTHRYADPPTLRNGHHCVLAHAGNAATAQLSWCATQEAFVKRSYEQTPPRPPGGARSERERVADILLQMGLEVSEAEAELIYENLAADPEVLEELFAAEASGELDTLLPPPPPTPGITRKP